MFTIIALGAIAMAAALIYLRQRRGQQGLAQGLAGAPASLRAAARRLSYRTQADVHPVASIPSAQICTAAMAAAFGHMDDNTPPGDAVLSAALQKHLQVTPEQSADMITLAHWLVEQGGGPTPAFERLTKRLKQLDHGPSFDKLMRVLGDVAAAGTKGMPSPRQADAMGALARIFRTA